MKKWLEDQRDKESITLDGVEEMVREVVDALLPQIRLAALEHGDTADVEMMMSFTFTERGVHLETKAAVLFPAKVVVAEGVL